MLCLEKDNAVAQHAPKLQVALVNCSDQYTNVKPDTSEKHPRLLSMQACLAAVDVCISFAAQCKLFKT